MHDVELLGEHLRAIEYLLMYGDLTETDKILAKQRLMVIVGKLRLQSAGQDTEKKREQ